VTVINFGRGERECTSLTTVLGVVIFIVAYLSDSFRNGDDNLVFIFNNGSLAEEGMTVDEPSY